MLLLNVYALNRTRTKPRRGEQAQVYTICKIIQQEELAGVGAGDDGIGGGDGYRFTLFSF
jgi:hypothetical protein